MGGFPPGKCLITKSESPFDKWGFIEWALGVASSYSASNLFNNASAASGSKNPNF